MDYKKNNIYIGNNIKILKKMKSNSVDMIFADPPYFMQTEGKLERYDKTEYKGVDDEWDKFNSFKEYDIYTEKWLNECKRILKINGTIWVIGTFHNIFRIGFIIQNLGFWILNDIIWKKTNPTPNFKGTRFTNQQETLIWASKTKKSKFTFNYKTMKKINNDKQMKSIWEIRTCIGNERIKDKNNRKLHNTQKPIKLIDYIILSSTKKGDLILDPFFGTGTTGASAKSLNRNFIGIEREKEYVLYANKRIKNQKINLNYSSKIITSFYDKKKAKIDLIQELEKTNSALFLYDNNNNEYKLNTNGKVIINNTEYSIHKSTEILSNKYQNGWKFWYFKKNNKLYSIDKLRVRYE